MRLMNTAPHLRKPSRSDDEIRRDVTELGLTYSLATRWTSFVAVSQKVVNAEPELAGSADVPLQMVEGVTKHAYPASKFSGGSTPEPGVLGGLAALTLAGLFAAFRRRRS